MEVEEVRSDQSPASLVAKEIPAIGSFEEVVAFHHFHQPLAEPAVGPAYLEEGEGEAVRQKKAEVWKVQAACCSEVVEAARKVLCSEAAYSSLEVVVEVACLLLPCPVWEEEVAD